MTSPSAVRPFFQLAEQGRFDAAADYARRLLHDGDGSIVLSESSIPEGLKSLV